MHILVDAIVRVEGGWKVWMWCIPGGLLRISSLGVYIYGGV